MGRRTFGSTRQLPSGRWQASYLAPDGSRRTADKTFAEAADANAWLSNIEATAAAENGGRQNSPVNDSSTTATVGFSSASIFGPAPASCMRGSGAAG
jgi:hypothetical protein